MIVSDDEWIPFQPRHFDGAISCINSHWIQNLKGNSYFHIIILINIEYGIKIHNVLEKESPFLGAMIGGNSLYELKYDF